MSQQPEQQQQPGGHDEDDERQQQQQQQQQDDPQEDQLGGITSKLRTQTLKEQEDGPGLRSSRDEAGFRSTSDKDGGDSGTESDDDPLIQGAKLSSVSQTACHDSEVSLVRPDLSLALRDSGSLCDESYSSEEELKEIIRCDRRKKHHHPQRLSQNQQETTTPSGSKPRLSGSSSVAEKRKWSEVSESPRHPALVHGVRANSTSSGDEEVTGYLRPAHHSSCSCSSSSSSAALGSTPTPVQFCASPPLDVYRPLRQSQSPPLKLFHLAQHPDHDAAAAAPRGAGAAARQHHDPAEEDDGVGAEAEDDDQEEEEIGVQSDPMAHSSSASAPGLSPSSPSKRHRSRTPRPHHLQRPCLDFEKMQQIKKRVVTSWRPHGTELSLFCW